MEVQRSIEISAPPEKVWPLLVEPEKIMKWFTLLQKFEYTGEKSSGVGATFYYEEKSCGQLMKMNYIVTEWVENKKLAFSMTSGDVKKEEQVWSLEPTETGCRFTAFEEFEMPMGIIGKIIGALFVGRMVSGSMKKIITNLKTLAEA